MVGRILSALEGSVPTLHGAAYVLGGAAVASQILAFFRDRLLAHLFGAGSALDVYYAAFRIQDFIFLSVASLVSLSVLLPFVIDREKEGVGELRAFVGRVVSFFGILVAFSCAVAYFLVPILLPLLFGGLFGRGYDEEFIELSRLLLLSPFLLGLSSVFASITQAKRRFYLYALSPLVYNLGIIGGIIFLAPVHGILGVGYGVIIGAFLHLLIQVPSIMRDRLLPIPTLFFSAAEFLAIARLSVPRTAALTLNHLVLLALTMLAARSTEGSVSVLNLAINLQSVPLAIVGASYSLAAFPTLARHFSLGEIDAFLLKTIVALRHILFWALPISVLFIVLRAQIVRVVLGTGAFDWVDTRLTAAALALFAVSILCQSISLLLIRAYYAASFTKKPLSAGLLQALVTVSSAFLLGHLFSVSVFFRDFLESLLRVEGLPGTDILILPLAFSIGSIAGTLALLLMFRRDFPGGEGLLPSFFLNLSGAVIAGFACYQFLEIFTVWVPTDTVFGLFAQGLFSGILGLMVGAAVLSLLNSRELREVMSSLQNRVWKTEAVQVGE